MNVLLIEHCFGAVPSLRLGPGRPLYCVLATTPHPFWVHEKRDREVNVQ